jgi:hypothetical protein
MERRENIKLINARNNEYKTKHCKTCLNCILLGERVLNSNLKPEMSKRILSD